MPSVFGSNFDYGQSPLYKDDGDSIYTVAIEDTETTEGDIKLIAEGNIADATDIQMAVRDVLRDAGLETAVMMSLFTDRRAGTDDLLPDNSGDKRGWWGDALNADGDADGSKLWLTFRGKITNNTITQIREYAREALQWLIDDNVAERIEVDVVRTALTIITWTVQIFRPKTDKVELFKYYYNWQYQIYGRA